MSRAAVTTRGASTRARIVKAAADLMLDKGVRATTLDDVRAASGTSKSQLFHYFPDGKAGLLRAVVRLQAERVLDAQRLLLEDVKGLDGLGRWRDAIVDHQERRGFAGGCPLGSLAAEIAEHDEPARVLLAQSFTRWQGLVADTLRRLQSSGALADSADCDALALAVMTSLQGGLLLAQTTRTAHPLEAAIDAALRLVSAHGT